MVAVGYEFCIPATPEHEAEVRAIDPTAQVYRASPGRIGCGVGQALVIGSTNQSDHRDMLERLARLDYVTRIDRFYGE
jgi:hypothetical protein